MLYAIIMGTQISQISQILFVLQILIGTQISQIPQMLYVIIMGTQISRISQITRLEYDTMDSFVHVFLAKINK